MTYFLLEFSFSFQEIWVVTFIFKGSLYNLIVVMHLISRERDVKNRHFQKLHEFRPTITEILCFPNMENPIGEVNIELLC